MKYNFYSNQFAEPKEVSLQTLSTASNLQGETIPMTCSCFFTYEWNSPQELFVSKYFQKQILLKQIFRSGTTMLKEKRKKFCSILEDALQNRDEILFKKLFFKFKKYWKKLIYCKEKVHQPTVLMLLIISLIAESFVLGQKPESFQNFSTNAVWSGVKSIGTIFFFQ
jgi:hypothetical protein